MSETGKHASLRLKARVGRRVERGHLWVFANEVESVQGKPAPGDEVCVYDAKGRFVGMALTSASSLIRGRIYSRRRDQACDRAFIAERLADALALRHRIAAAEGEPGRHSYRLCHSEADGLPGLVADVYGANVVIQIATAAMERRREDIVASLVGLLAPDAIVDRGDMPHRTLEGLEPTSGVVHGTLEGPAPVQEGGLRLWVDLIGGQKTGYFLDQRANRAAMAPWANGARVLDLCCYVGAWSLLAARAGAVETLGIDASAPALALAERSREENGLAADRVRFERADVFEWLTARAQAGDATWDIVVLDPPALAKSKRDRDAALRGYRELNRRAMSLLAPGGLLVTCSCSHVVSREDFRQMLTVAARDAGVELSVLASGGQAADHPEHLATTETAYLKALTLVRRDG